MQIKVVVVVGGFLLIRGTDRQGSVKRLDQPLDQESQTAPATAFRTQSPLSLASLPHIAKAKHLEKF